MSNIYLNLIFFLKKKKEKKKKKKKGRCHVREYRTALPVSTVRSQPTYFTLMNKR